MAYLINAYAVLNGLLQWVIPWISDCVIFTRKITPGPFGIIKEMQEWLQYFREE